MPHFFYQAVSSHGEPASGAMEADNAQAAHGKLVMAGYRQIQILSNQTTTALQDDLDAMSPDARQEAARARILASAEAETERLAGMVGNLLDMNRVESGALRATPEVLDPAELARQVGPMVGAELEQRLDHYFGRLAAQGA